MSLQGLENVVRNLNREIKAIEGRSMAGLIRAAILVRRDMDETPPLIPVDKGFLRGSWFTNPGQSSKGPFVTCGFGISYAVYVHEMLNAHFQRPGAGAKFFQASLRRNTDRIIAVIKEDAQIK